EPLRPTDAAPTIAAPIDRPLLLPETFPAARPRLPRQHVLPPRRDEAPARAGDGARPGAGGHHAPAGAGARLPGRPRPALAGRTRRRPAPRAVDARPHPGSHGARRLGRTPPGAGGPPQEPDP